MVNDRPDNCFYNSQIAVIGGRMLSSDGETMARFIGNRLIEMDCCLVTDGKNGAGEWAARGALEACQQKGINPQERIFCIIPHGKQQPFQIGSTLYVGKDLLESQVTIFKRTWGAIVIGGDGETLFQIRLAVLQAIVEGYQLIPISGTGGEADRICSLIPPFEDDILNEPLPSVLKAEKIVERIRQSPCWYSDIDIMAAHDEWFVSKSRNPIADEMARIRHRYF